MVKMSMAKHSVISECFREMVIRDKAGYKMVEISPSSSRVQVLYVKYLKAMQKQGYINGFKVDDVSRSLKIKVGLNGQLKEEDIQPVELEQESIFSTTMSPKNGKKQ